MKKKVFSGKDGKPRVLVVEDEESHRILLEMHLKDAGYDYSLTESPQEALALLDKEKFDLIITDIVMPDMDGIEFLEEIKQKKLNINVILISGVATGPTIQGLKRMGAFECLPKPYDKNVLLDNIRKALK